MSKRTPYDTGKRAEPRPWTAPHRESEDDWGKVDFEDDAGGTVATLYIEQGDGRSGYTLKGWANEPLKVDIGMEDPEEPQVYWDQEPDDERAEALALGYERSPYGVDTARIIDLQQGGVIAYCHKDTADRLVRAIWTKEGPEGPAVEKEGIEGVSTIHWFPGDLVEWAHDDAYGAKVWDYGVVGMVERVLGRTTLWVYVPGHKDPRQWPAAQCRLLRRNNPNKEGS